MVSSEQSCWPTDPEDGTAVRRDDEEKGGRYMRVNTKRMGPYICALSFLAIVGCGDRDISKDNQSVVLCTPEAHAGLSKLESSRRKKVFDSMLAQARDFLVACEGSSSRAALGPLVQAKHLIEDAKDGKWYPGVVILGATPGVRQDGLHYIQVKYAEMSGGIDTIEIHVIFPPDLNSDVIVSTSEVFPGTWTTFASELYIEYAQVSKIALQELIKGRECLPWGSGPCGKPPLPVEDDVHIYLRIRNLAGIWSNVILLKEDSM
jgi:hypothetical protein